MQERAELFNNETLKSSFEYCQIVQGDKNYSEREQEISRELMFACISEMNKRGI